MAALSASTTANGLVPAWGSTREARQGYHMTRHGAPCPPWLRSRSRTPSATVNPSPRLLVTRASAVPGADQLQRDASLEQQQQQQQQEQIAPPVALAPSPQQSAPLLPPAAAPTPVFCEGETLGGLLRQFAMRGEGFDSGLQVDGLLAYYRRLGCTPQQIQEALARALPAGPSPSPGAGPSPGSPAVAAAGPRPSALSSAAVVEVDGGGGRGSLGLPWAQSGGLSAQLQVAAWELLAAAVAAAALVAFQSRPRGWSRRDLLEVRTSTVAGRGVFARSPIPSGTVLGAYPGRLRSAAEMVAKCEYAPMAASYAFRTADGRFLDPTDATGRPSPYPQPGWPWPLETDVVLSYVNEPPKTSPGTNATVEDGSDPGELLFVASTDIPAGAEVLIDYGLSYDRSSYGRG